MNNPTVYFPKAWRLFDAFDWLAQRGVPATEQWVCPTIDFGESVMFWTGSDKPQRHGGTEERPAWGLERGVWDARKHTEAGR